VKTISLKKVSAVAVASLGFGLLSVVPANAANDNIATDLVSVASATASVGVGSAASTVVSFSLGSATTNNDGDTGKVTVAVTSKPADSTVAIANADGANSSATADVLTNTGNDAKFNDSASSQSSGVFTATQTAADGTSIAAADTVAIGTLSITPDKAGIYVVTLTGMAADGTTPGTGANVKTFTVYAGYSAGGTVNTNKAFPTQGSNTSTGWAATAGGQATVRITGLAASTTYWATVNNGSIIAATERDNSSDYIDPVVFTNGTNFSGGFKFTTDSSATISEAMDITIADTGSPATTTVSVVTYDAATGAATTFVTATVTWGVAAAPSAQYSLLTLNTTNGTTDTGAAADTTVTSASSSVSSMSELVEISADAQLSVSIKLKRSLG
jgi:hypothetical protein